MSPDRKITDRCLVFEQIEWHVVMRGGGVVVVHADGYSEEADECVFVVLVRGNPNFEQTVASFPRSIVVDVFNP